LGVRVKSHFQVSVSGSPELKPDSTERPISEMISERVRFSFTTDLVCAEARYVETADRVYALWELAVLDEANILYTRRQVNSDESYQTGSFVANTNPGSEGINGYYAAGATEYERQETQAEAKIS
jgi:hypothetical protein